MKKQGLFKKTVESSVILNFIRGTVKLVSDNFRKSVCGTVFVSDGGGESLFLNGKIGTLLSCKARRNSPFRRFSRFVAAGFEKSFVFRMLQRLYNELLQMKLRTAGSFLLTYSVFSAFALVLQYYTGTVAVNAVDAFFTLLSFALSLPLLASGRTVLDQFSKSRFLGPVIREGMGIDTDEKKREMSGFRSWKRLYEVAPILGILFGSLTVFIPSSRFVMMFVAIPAIMLIAAIPETGVILTIGAIPVYSLMGEMSVDVLSVIIYVAFAGYVFKALRGKRTVSFGFADVAIFFVYLIFLSACFGSSASGSFEGVQRMSTFVLAYFLFVFLIKNRAWLKRAVNALVFSWTTVAFLGILASLMSNVAPVVEFLNHYCADPDRFFIFGRSGCAVYMLMPAFPFLWAKLSDPEERGNYIPCTLFFILMLGCIALGGNLMPMGGVLAELGVYAVCVSPSFLFCVVPLGLMFFLLNGVRLPLIYNMIERSAEFAAAISSENLYANKGVFRAMADGIVSGVGMGSESFSNIYPNYAFAGFETLTRSGSSLLDLIFGLGIISFAVIALVLFFCIRSSFGQIRRMGNGTDAKYLAASVSSLVGILFSASADSVFVCEVMFLYLWILVAFGVAGARIRREEDQKATIRHLDTPTHADMEMPYVRVRRKTNQNNGRA